MADGFEWIEAPLIVFLPALGMYERSVRGGLYDILEEYEPEVENWMSDNAPWTDRTGNARQSLHVDIEPSWGIPSDEISFWMAHGVEYGVYLELKNAGVYAVIGPALDEFGPQIWDEIAALMGL
jgi:hypothetical protein